jgi:dienelactone hydrolase
MNFLSRAAALALAGAWLAGGVAAETVTRQATRPQAKAPTPEPPLAADIHEEIAHVDVELTLFDGRKHAGRMVVTHFRPAGPGPFPAVIFSHGRNAATRHEPVRWRALMMARYWTRRGFAVLVPTRIGYGELGQTVDPEVSGGCSNANFRPALAAMTAQIEATAAFARHLAWIDGSRLLLVGVSYGGFATIAATARPVPGVIAGVNFAGGLGGNPKQRPGQPCQGERIVGLAAEFGARSRVPQLWLYAENDTYWGRDWPRRWHEAFSAAGGKARLESFQAVGEEGHRVMSGGFQLWRPVVDRFVAGLGFKVPAAAPHLSATGYAGIDDVDKVPHLKQATRAEAYTRFLAADVPRAFAISPTGAWGWRTGLDAVEIALQRCQMHARSPCSLYAVDDRVVWKSQGQ